MPHPDLELTLDLTAEDYQDGFALLYLRRRTLRRLVIVVLVPVLPLIWGALFGDMLIGGIVFLVLALWSAWLLAFGQRYFSGVLARRLMRTVPALRETRRYAFRADGLSVGLGDQPAAGIPWRLFVGYSCDDRVLILYDAPQQIRVFPRRLLSDADIATIIRLAEAGGVARI